MGVPTSDCNPLNSTPLRGRKGFLFLDTAQVLKEQPPKTFLSELFAPKRVHKRAIARRRGHHLGAGLLQVLYEASLRTALAR